MKKICSAVITLAILAGALCGCFPTGEIEVVDEDYQSVLERAEKIDNFTLNLELPKNTPETVPTLYTKLKTWNLPYTAALYL